MSLASCLTFSTFSRISKLFKCSFLFKKFYNLAAYFGLYGNQDKRLSLIGYLVHKYWQCYTSIDSVSYDILVECNVLRYQFSAIMLYVCYRRLCSLLCWEGWEFSILVAYFECLFNVRCQESTEYIIPPLFLHFLSVQTTSSYSYPASVFAPFQHPLNTTELELVGNLKIKTRSFISSTSYEPRAGLLSEMSARTVFLFLE
jgi:hypothetical protein